MKLSEVNIVSEGQQISGILTTSSEPNKRVVLLAHGGPGGNKEGPDGIFVRFAERLGEEGIASLRFDFRGSGESEGDPTKWTIAQQVKDLSAVLDFVLAKGYLFPGLVGESLGGTVAILGYDRRYKAIALWWPAIYLMQTSLSAYLTAEKLGELARNGYVVDGDTKVGKAFLEEIQQIVLDPNLNQLQIPILLVHGDNDHEVPYSQSIEAMRMIKSTRQLLVVKGADHGLRKPVEQNQAIEVSLSWFKKYLV